MATVREGSSRIILLFLGTLCWGAPSWAQLSGRVEVDRSEMYEDESLQVVYSVTYQGQRSDFSGIELGLDAPDFDELNQFDSPTFYQMSYVNGVTRSETQTRFTKVLRPKKKGRLTLRGIYIKLDGKTVTADDIVVNVVAGGAQGAKPPRGYGMGGALSMSGKRGSRLPLMIRAEVSKTKVYKGEQLTVSFYSYRRGQIGQLDAAKLPDFKGFLKDDPELPLLKRPLSMGATVLDGWTYEKDLLARYVVYPLETGTLTVDPLVLKAMAYPDADSIFGNYLGMLNPRRFEAKSDPLKIEVVDLPTQGRPRGFGGAVGDINVQSKVDKTEAKVGDPVTLLVRLEGRANFASIEVPQAVWPEGLELFDSKSMGRSSQAGVGEKNFEYILIPRKPGKFTLPLVEFSFFNPKSKSYETKKISKHELVATGSPSSGWQSSAHLGSSGAAAGNGSNLGSNLGTQISSGQTDLRYIKLAPVGPESSTLIVGGQPLWRWLYLVVVAGLLFFALQLVFGITGKARDRVKRSALGRESVQMRYLKELLRDLRKNPTQELHAKAYAELEQLVFEVIQNRTGIQARALSRDEIRQDMERHSPQALKRWDEIVDILAAADAIRFAQGQNSTGNWKAAEAADTFEILTVRMGKWVQDFEVTKT